MVKALFDHNMPPSIARALNEIVAVDGHEAWALRDKFKTTITDIDYFTQLGHEGDWIVISKDRSNARRAPERAAILKSGVLAFYLASSVEKQRLNEQAATILWQWDKIVAHRGTTASGLFELPIGKRSKFRSL
ncbi:hypothetical protein GCM10017056_10490 [Seohaeicola zhoushanensis]|uniref:VapC45 PIN like domain-containing protein n=2 Tax=Seohaeicola zhoushanensis TaxID=1569283 RepID=A0A8J3GVL9_9RHOB|nr:hypothetical protein GCM10017056_10490 [Seohaeicola zhoushanensis]